MKKEIIKKIIRHELRSLSEQRMMNSKPMKSSSCPEASRPTVQDGYAGMKEFNLRTVGDSISFMQEVINNPDTDPMASNTISVALQILSTAQVGKDTPLTDRDPKIIGFLFLVGTGILFWRCGLFGHEF